MSEISKMQKSLEGCVSCYHKAAPKREPKEEGYSNLSKRGQKAKEARKLKYGKDMHSKQVMKQKKEQNV